MNKVCIVLLTLILAAAVGLGGCTTINPQEAPTTIPVPTPAPTPAPVPTPTPPDLSLSPPDGHVGSEITVRGTGFIAGSEVTIFYAMKTNTPGYNLKTGTSTSRKPDDPDDRRMATVLVDPDQTFLVRFIAPSKYGEHTVTATDGTNTLTAIFTMDDFPPPIPGPQLPEEGTRAVSRTHFEWSKVEDPSGITYSIQVCTNQSFRDEYLVLDKKEIPVPEYTLSREESLKSVGKENPYYWRVQAVDGAGNKSGWRAPASFYVN